MATLNGAILRKVNKNLFLHLLYRNKPYEIGEIFLVNLYNGVEYESQLNSTTFIIFEKARIYIACLRILKAKKSIRKV